MIPLRALALACLLAPLAAGAQWMYLDQDGRKVFSDKAPPPETPEKNILRKPGMRSASPAAEQAPASADKTVASAPKVTGKDRQLEEKKKQAEAAEAEKKALEAEKLAKAQSENCDRARKARATLTSGQRVSRTNAKGEREFLPDSEREAEVKRLDGVMAADCKAAQ